MSRPFLHYEFLISSCYICHSRLLTRIIWPSTFRSLQQGSRLRWFWSKVRQIRNWCHDIDSKKFHLQGRLPQSFICFTPKPITSRLFPFILLHIFTPTFNDILHCTLPPILNYLPLSICSFHPFLYTQFFVIHWIIFYRVFNM